MARKPGNYQAVEIPSLTPFELKELSQWSVRFLSEQLGVDKNTYGYWVKNWTQYRDTDTERIMKLCGAIAVINGFVEI